MHRNLQDLVFEAVSFPRKFHPKDLLNQIGRWHFERSNMFQLPNLPDPKERVEAPPQKPAAFEPDILAIRKPTVTPIKIKPQVLHRSQATTEDAWISMGKHDEVSFDGGNTNGRLRNHSSRNSDILVFQFFEFWVYQLNI